MEMTRRPDPSAAAHLAYIDALRAGHAFCEDYVGRCADDLRLYTEMADGIAFTALGADGQPKHYFVADSEPENET
jgi:hypothetical protein